MSYEGITGDMRTLSESRFITLNDCVNVAGDLNETSIVLKEADLTGTPVIGILPITSKCVKWTLHRTELTADHIQECLNNLILLLDEEGMSNRNPGDYTEAAWHFICTEDMPYIDVAYHTQIDTLEEAGWVIQVNIEGIY